MAEIIEIKSNKDYDKLTPAARALAQGELVAFPTETVYGLGANALNDIAVKSIFTAKGRPQDNPLIVHIADKGEIFKLVKDVPDSARKILENLTPGPVTIVLEKSDLVPDVVTAGGKTVAIRIPESEIARELIRLAGVPVAAPSANTSGKPSPTRACHVAEDLEDKVSYIVDGGACRVGLESTVVDLTVTPPQILRPGGVTHEELSALLGEVTGYCAGENDNTAPKSPGMKYRHYAPKAQMMVFEGENIEEYIKEEIKKHQGKRVCVLCAGSKDYDDAISINCGETPEGYSKYLFDALRFADSEECDVVLAEFPFEKCGITVALFNRINKSCGGNVRICK